MADRRLRSAERELDRTAGSHPTEGSTEGSAEGSGGRGLPARRPGAWSSVPAEGARTFASADLRTIALVGHRGSGKTTLAEAILEAGRVIREMGSIDVGTTLLDHTPDAIAHRQTHEVSTAWFEWSERVVQLLDTPGAAALSEIRDVGVRAAEAALVVLDAAAGVQVGAEDAIRSAGARPVIAVLTKLDRVDPRQVDVAKVAADLGHITGVRAVPIHLPFVDDDGALVGIIDVITGNALRFADDGSGAFSPEPVPERMRAAVAAAHEVVSEAVAMTDDRLLEEYLEYLALPVATLTRALRAAVASRQVVPVLMTSAVRRIGVATLIDALVGWTPAYGAVPAELIEHDGTRTPLDPNGSFVVQVLAERRDDKGEPYHLVRILAGAPPRGDWIDGRSGAAHRIRKAYRVRGPRRATAPSIVPGAIVATWDPLPLSAGATLTDGARWEVVSPEPRPAMMALWIRCARPQDELVVQATLEALVRADRGLSLRSDAASGARLLAGQDEAHLKVAVERLRSWSGGVAITAELPPVGYVETPSAPVHGIEGVHVHKDSAGLVEEYGMCEVALEPLPPDEGTAFVDAIGDVEDDLPRKYRWAIDQGARDAMRHGPTAGYPVVGVELRLTGGAYDILQSTDEHFRLAGERAARAALERAGTRVLEPWSTIEVTVPETTVGDLISDVTSHRGRIVGLQVDGDRVSVRAEAPYRELRTFVSRLRTLTSGRGVFRTHATHYEPVPEHLVSEVIAASPHRPTARARATAAR